MSLQNLCIASAEQYLAFLNKNEKGLIEIAVHQKQHLGDNIWQLILARRIFDLDSILLKFGGRLYQSGDFVVDIYDDNTRTLILKLSTEVPGFSEAVANRILIVSDLKFLVKRVRDWFVGHGHEIKMPIRLPEPIVVAPPIDLNDDQRSAFCSALTGGLSYAWGPPGTGKTRHVLTAAALHLMMEGKLVAVVAPTNNAIEVAVQALLETASVIRVRADIAEERRARLDLSRFLRLGSPSRAFAEDYPSVCEVRGIAKRIAILQETLAVLGKVIRFRKRTSALTNIESVLALAASALELTQQRERMWMRLGQIVTQIATDQGRLNSFLSRLFGHVTGATAEAQARLGENLNEQQLINHEVAALENTITSISHQIVISRIGSVLLDDLYSSFKSARCEEVQAFVARLTTIANNTRVALATAEVLAIPYARKSLQDIKVERENLETEIVRLKRLTLAERLKSVGVVGMTLDGFIARFADSVPFSHIFLDEAGYAPLIKSLPLLRHSVPVTLLGDHLQLPPVCEIRDSRDSEMRQPENMSVVLWPKPAVYLRRVLETIDADHSLPDWLLAHTLESPVEIIETSVLRATYRFGPNLAAILDEFIYKMGFHSAGYAAEDLVIRLISTPRERSSDRTNRSECEAIRRLLSDRGISETAILTPYRKQVSQLTRSLPSAFHDDVMTVHRAQGREWATVILSAADTSQDPFLTNTDNPAGRSVLNTAVSRAQKELLLVCDRDYWMARRDRNQQLLCRLIEQAHDFD